MRPFMLVALASAVAACAPKRPPGLLAMQIDRAGPES